MNLLLPAAKVLTPKLQPDPPAVTCLAQAGAGALPPASNCFLQLMHQVLDPTIQKAYYEAGRAGLKPYLDNARLQQQSQRQAAGLQGQLGLAKGRGAGGAGGPGVGEAGGPDSGAAGAGPSGMASASQGAVPRLGWARGMRGGLGGGASTSKASAGAGATAGGGGGVGRAPRDRPVELAWSPGEEEDAEQDHVRAKRDEE